MNASDPHQLLSAIEAQLTAALNRAAACEKRETEARVEKEAALADVTRLKHTKETLQPLLRTAPAAPLRAQAELHLFNSKPNPALPLAGPHRVRCGPKRLEVLEAIGRATKENRAATAHYLHGVTQHAKDLIFNVLYEDTKRGYVQRDASGGATMTPAGFEFLRILNSPVGQ